MASKIRSVRLFKHSGGSYCHAEQDLLVLRCSHNEHSICAETRGDHTHMLLVCRRVGNIDNWIARELVQLLLDQRTISGQTSQSQSFFWRDSRKHRHHRIDPRCNQLLRLLKELGTHLCASCNDRKVARLPRTGCVRKRAKCAGHRIKLSENVSQNCPLLSRRPQCIQTETLFPFIRSRVQSNFRQSIRLTPQTKDSVCRHASHYYSKAADYSRDSRPINPAGGGGREARHHYVDSEHCLISLWLQAHFAMGNAHE